MKKDVNHITIMNVHWNNHGDEAALMALLGGLRKLYPDCSITIPLKDPKSVECFPDLKYVNTYPGQFKTSILEIWVGVLTNCKFVKNKVLKRLIKSLSSSDLIIYGPGGSVINDRFFWRKQMEYLLPFIYAKFYRIPLYVAAPSIGPFTKRNNFMRTWLLKTAKILCVREDISKKYLDTIGINKNVEVTIDSAFLSEIDQSNNQEKLENYLELKEFLSQHERVIGITITDFTWHVKYNQDTELINRINNSFHEFIEKLESDEFGILFIPQLFGNQNDSKYMSQFAKKHSFVMDEKYDADFQQHIISKIHSVVGMRYHSNIFSAKMCTPFVAVMYEEKMEGFIQQADLLEYSIPLKEISFDKLTEKFNLVSEDYSKIKEKLQKGLPNWRDRARRTINLLRDNY